MLNQIRGSEDHHQGTNDSTDICWEKYWVGEGGGGVNQCFNFHNYDFPFQTIYAILLKPTRYVCDYREWKQRIWNKHLIHCLKLECDALSSK